MLEGKDDFVPWDERGGRYGPIARYAKTDRFSQPPIMVSCAIFVSVDQLGATCLLMIAPTVDIGFTIVRTCV